MLDLSRTVRFCLNGPGDVPGAVDNGFSAWPAMRGLGRYYELQVRCRGEADAVTGYFINIKHIDQAVRQAVLPYLASLIADEQGTADLPMGQVMQQIITRLQKPLKQSVVRVGLSLSPYCQLEMETPDMSHILIRQQYEFSAAHRLHVPDLDEQANRDLFGKCNNPSGHGHNYKVEVVVRCPVDAHGQTVQVAELDAVVNQAAIEPLDHKHLNVDVPAFAQMNPSVENIARVVHGMLLGPIQQQLGGKLVEVSVWETSKTVCTFAG